jgi:serralysin
MFGVPTGTTTITASTDNNIDGLLSDDRWASTSVTYSFTDNFSNDYESGYSNASIHSSSFQTLNSTQRAVARSWAKNYSDVSLLNLSELTGTNDRNATIRIAMSDDAAPTAYGYLPGNSVEGGDMFFNPDSYYNTPVLGDYAYHTFGHELGHALGLKHGHETGGVSNVSMNANRDSMEFSIMTYRSYIGAPLNGYPNETGGYAQSLMMYDIRAIQQAYGAKFTTNASNTTYTFSTTTGEMLVNGVGQGTPGANRIFRTVWDGNGIDTYDFSNYNTNLSIDLTPGGWSDLNVGGNTQRANLGDGNYARGHVFNALQYNNDVRSLIENANGGTGNDNILGNSANNVLLGNGGNDTLNGGVGNDTLNGGTGIDIMTGGTGNDLYYVDNTGDVVTETSNLATEIDTVYSSIDHSLGLNIERLTLTGTAAINGSGNSLNNIITGNSGTNILDGGVGNDTLNGGTGIDTMIGGTGNDLYYVDNTGDIVTETSNLATEIDTVYSSIDYSLGLNIERLNLTGTAAINGSGNSLNNTIKGNSAANILYGGAGNDILTGGLGADIFQFNSTTEGIDTISDFTFDDRIGIFASGFGGGLSAGTALDVAQLLSVTSGSAATNTSQRFIYNSTNGGLFFDLDGNGASAAVQFATLSSQPTLTATNFEIV